MGHMMDMGHQSSFDNDNELMLRTYMVDSIIIDFKTAFDRVPHKIVIDKLEALNIDRRVVRWIAEFLKERVQCRRGESSTDRHYSGVTAFSCGRSSEVARVLASPSLLGSWSPVVEVKLATIEISGETLSVIILMQYDSPGIEISGDTSGVGSPTPVDATGEGDCPCRSPEEARVLATLLVSMLPLETSDGTLSLAEHFPEVACPPLTTVAGAGTARCFLAIGAVFGMAPVDFEGAA
ncbi:hypothetical protein B566_EDAN015564 [Ephemera danica]|nr:hypothetical protein B566_EDAN015564 [Ephemera danica]